MSCPDPLYDYEDLIEEDEAMENYLKNGQLVS